MNKYIFILGFVGTAFLSACSSDDLTIVPSPDEEEAIVVEAGKDSDVPITLGVGMGRAITRTPLNPVDVDGKFNTPDGQYFGVFCLAIGKQAGAPNITAIPATDADIKWSPAYSTIYPYANWMDNIPAKVTSDGTTSNVTFLEKVYYYPFGNWYHYNFFAYYPWQSSGVTTIAKACFVDFTIDGKKDIIWGKTLGDGVFSAKYMREHPTTVPEFEFEHQLTQLVFHIKPRETDKTEFSAEGYKLTEVKLKKVHKYLQLCVASKPEDSHTPGTPSTAGSLSEMKVWKTDDSDPFSGGAEISVVPSPPSDETLICYAMVHPSDISNIQVYVKMEQTIGGTEVIEKNITLPSPVGGFLKGRKYKVDIELKKD